MNAKHRNDQEETDLHLGNLLFVTEPQKFGSPAFIHFWNIFTQHLIGNLLDSPKHTEQNLTFDENLNFRAKSEAF